MLGCIKLTNMAGMGVLNDHVAFLAWNRFCQIKLAVRDLNYIFSSICSIQECLKRGTCSGAVSLKLRLPSWMSGLEASKCCAAHQYLSTFWCMTRYLALVLISNTVYMSHWTVNADLLPKIRIKCKKTVHVELLNENIRRYNNGLPCMMTKWSQQQVPLFTSMVLIHYAFQFLHDKHFIACAWQDTDVQQWMMK